MIHRPSSVTRSGRFAGCESTRGPMGRVAGAWSHLSRAVSARRRRDAKPSGLSAPWRQTLREVVAFEQQRRARAPVAPAYERQSAKFNRAGCRPWPYLFETFDGRARRCRHRWAISSTSALPRNFSNCPCAAARRNIKSSAPKPSLVSRRTTLRRHTGAPRSQFRSSKPRLSDSFKRGSRRRPTCQ